MKNKLINILAVSGLIFGLSSCNEEAWNLNETEGVGDLELSSISIELKDAQKVIVSPSTRGSDINDFQVTVVDKNSGSTIGKWTYGNMPEILTLPVGNNYSLQVESHEVALAEWENPYYKGEKDFEITSGKITRIGEVEAKFASLKVTVNFGDDLKKEAKEDTKVIVKANNGASLEFGLNETRAGYFAFNEGTTFAAHFEGTIGGVVTEHATPFVGVEAGQHHILTYSVKSGPEIPEQSGQIDGDGVSLDVNYDVEDVNSNTDVEEDLIDGGKRPGTEDNNDPKDPDEDNKDNPGDTDSAEIDFSTLNSPNLNLDSVNIPTDDFGNAIVLIKAKNGIKTFKVEISSTDEDGLLMPALEEMKLDAFELTDPGDPETIDNLTNLELPYGDDVKNKTEVEFNITNFVPLLKPFRGLHSFKMIVTDNNNVTKTLVLQFKA